MSNPIPIFLQGVRMPIGLAEYDPKTGKLTADIQPKFRELIRPRVHNFSIRKDS